MSEAAIDYTEYLTEMIENQQTEIEQLEGILDFQQNEIEQLAISNQLLEEEINGFNIVVNQFNEARTVFIVAAVFFILWKIIAKWIFGGV